MNTMLNDAERRAMIADVKYQFCREALRFLSDGDDPRAKLAADFLRQLDVMQQKFIEAGLESQPPKATKWVEAEILTGWRE